MIEITNMSKNKSAELYKTVMLDDIKMVIFEDCTIVYFYAGFVAEVKSGHVDIYNYEDFLEDAGTYSSIANVTDLEKYYNSHAIYYVKAGTKQDDLPIHIGITVDFDNKNLIKYEH